MIQHKWEEQVNKFHSTVWITKFVFFLYNDFVIKNVYNEGIYSKFRLQHFMCYTLRSISDVQSDLYQYVQRFKLVSFILCVVKCHLFC
jgi:hypothetical protein